MLSSQDHHPKIVISRWYALVVGWIMILAAPLLLWFVVSKIASGDADAAVLIAVLPVLLGSGIWMVGMTTTIVFRQEHMTVTRGHIPLFLWWLRKRSISKESSRTAKVTSRFIRVEINQWEYRVDVTMESGENLRIFRWDDPGEADYLVTRIHRWSG